MPGDALPGVEPQASVLLQEVIEIGVEIEFPGEHVKGGGGGIGRRLHRQQPPSQFREKPQTPIAYMQRLLRSRQFGHVSAVEIDIPPGRNRHAEKGEHQVVGTFDLHVGGHSGAKYLQGGGQ